jgi:putative colanic acid biosynthesis UDP-glucose lipid carrier transferase
MSDILKSGGLGVGFSQSAGSASSAWSKAQADAKGWAASRDPLRLLVGIVGAADAFVIFASSLIAFIVRHGIERVPADILTTSVLATVLALNALSIAGAYGEFIKKNLIPQIWRAMQAWTIVFALLLTIGYLTKTGSEYSRTWATLWFVSTMLGLSAVRFVAVVQLERWRRAGHLATTVAIVDLGNRGTAFARKLTQNGSADVQLVGVFSRDDSGTPGKGISDLIALSRLFRIDEVFVLPADVCDAGSSDESSDLLPILRRIGTIPTNVLLCPSLPDLGQLPIRGTLLKHDIPALAVYQHPLGAWSSVFKRAEDVVIGVLALLILWPVMLIVAILVKLDSKGPVLFRQARQGFNNNVITVLKFRTMVHGSQVTEEVVQAKPNDRRVTRVGRVLRRTSIDELPQIFNVLRGEMSLVGPRPHAVVHNQQYAELIDDYLGRHRVQPGITGWAQINGLRGETDTVDKMRQRVEHDLFYIDRWSIALDLKIIVLTAVSILFDRRSAY